MSVIKIENLTFSYYGYVKPIFKNVSFSFDTNWKTGLIGRNGIGKSTLFKLLLNQETYQGKISKNVEFIKFPPNISDTSKLGIELYKELISDDEEWKLFRELSLLNVDENLVYREF
ncbi:Lsa family ABC-F type ribosomal protection protein, partial [Gardnerella vaginalis]